MSIKYKFILFACCILSVTLFITGCPAEDRIDTTPASTPAPTQTDPPMLLDYEPPAWEESYTILSYPQYQVAFIHSSDQLIQPGDAYMSQMLYEFLTVSRDPNQKFRIIVYELSFADRTQLYQEVIAPLNIQENFMEESTIYVTQDQLAQIIWPEEYAILLMKYNDTKAFDITIENLESCTDPFVPVVLRLRTDVEIPQQDCEAEWKDIAELYGIQVIPGFSEAYTNPHYFAFAHIPPETLRDMLDDERIREIIHQGDQWDNIVVDF